MLDVLSITSPIYLIMLLGYGMTRWGVFAKADMRLLGKFVLNLALPALVFRALAQRQVSDIFNPTYLLGYVLGSLAVLALGYSYSRRVAQQPVSSSAIAAMGMSCSNSGFVGYPILLLLMPPVAGVALALNMLVENLVVIPLLLVLADMEQGQASVWSSLRQSMMRLLRNPLVLGLVAGLLVSLSGLHLPSSLTRTIDLLAASSGALSLFVIGGTLVGLPLQGLGKQVLPIVLGKLLLHPLLVWLVVSALPLLGLSMLSPELHTAAVLMAAMPMMGIYVTLAQNYGQEDMSAAASLATTVLSFVTVSMLLGLLHLST
jgi:malonate transporter